MLDIEFELSDKQDFEILSKKLETLQGFNFRQIRITNKSKEVNNLNIFNELNFNYPDLQIGLNYSLENHYHKSGNFNVVFDYFSQFLDSYIGKILLVSGSSKRKFDIIQCLKMLNKFIEAGNFKEFSLAVAYNPFFKSITEKKIEKEKLIQKLSYDFVDTVYLQIGLDQSAIKEAINDIKKIREDVKIVNSVLYPSQKLLNNWRFRPWKGVFLTDNYLADITFAKKLAIDMIRFNKQNNISTLFTYFGSDFDSVVNELSKL